MSRQMTKQDSKLLSSNQRYFIMPSRKVQNDQPRTTHSTSSFWFWSRSSKYSLEGNMSQISIKTNNTTESSGECMRIENDGKVFWLKNGEMVQATMDTELAQAFALVVVSMSGKS